MTKKAIKYLRRLSPELYFRFMERFGERQIMKTVIGFGDFVEEYGWEFRGKFYSKHFRVDESKPAPVTTRQLARGRISRRFQGITRVSK